MKRNVNGKDVEMSPEEAAAMQAEWDRNAAIPRPQKQTSMELLLTTLRNKGVLTAQEVSELSLESRLR